MADFRAIAQDNSKVAPFVHSKWIESNDLQQYVEPAMKWEEDVLAMAKNNRVEGGPEAILCLGSSSFRLWDSSGLDMAPHQVVKRAYGGAKFCDLAIHVPKLVEGLPYRATMIFVANDISGSKSDKSAAEIQRLAELVIRHLQNQNPSAPIFIVAITPTPSRFEYWPKIRDANASLLELSKRLQNVRFVATEDEYLLNKKPREEFFKSDMLHQNDKGYSVWARLLKSALEQHLSAN